MNLSEKAAYLKGLFEGMKYDPESKEGKPFAGIIDLLDDMALSVLDLEDEQANLNDYVEDIDDDHGVLEEDYYGDEYCCGDCDICDEDCEFRDENEDDEDEKND